MLKLNRSLEVIIKLEVTGGQEIVNVVDDSVSQYSKKHARMNIFREK